MANTMDHGRKSVPSHRRRSLRAETRSAAVWTILSVIALAVVGLTMFFIRNRAGLLPWQRVPPYYSSVARAKPFPKTLSPSEFSDPSIARGYEIAQRIPEVLVQQPSYCRMLRHHHSLLACFVTTDAARCQGCLQEAYLADRMTLAGKSPEQIRNSIIAGEWRNVRLE